MAVVSSTVFIHLDPQSVCQFSGNQNTFAICATIHRKWKCIFWANNAPDFAEKTLSTRLSLYEGLRREVARRETKPRKHGTSSEKFAQELGVTRAGLYKYLNQENVPSLDILERAKVLGVEVKCGDLDLDLIKARAKKDATSLKRRCFCH